MILPTLEWTSDMKKCLGCSKNKPANDFGTTGNARALCSKCRSGSVVRTNKGTGRRKGDGSWVGDLFEGIGDFFSDLIP